MNQIWNGKWEISPSQLQTKDYNIMEHIHKCLTEKTQSIMSSCGSYATPNSGSSRWTPSTLNYDLLWGENCRFILFGNNHMGTPSCWVIELCLHLLWNAVGHIIKIYAQPLPFRGLITSSKLPIQTYPPGTLSLYGLFHCSSGFALEAAFFFYLFLFFFFPVRETSAQIVSARCFLTLNHLLKF